MKKLFFFAFILTTHSLYSQINAITAKAPSSRGSDHTIGVGFNYMWPSSGISARIGITEKLKSQVSFSYRGYGVYSWSNIGVELNYVFADTQMGFGDLEGFGYGGVGRGTIKWKDPLYQQLGIENFHWFSYNLGVGAEIFPDVFKSKLGIIAKLGFGSYGSYGLTTSVATGLLYGGAIHYYIK